MKHSLEMPVADGRKDGWTYGWDRIYRTPVGSAGSPKMLYTFLLSIKSFSLVWLYEISKWKLIYTNLLVLFFINPPNNEEFWGDQLNTHHTSTQSN